MVISHGRKDFPRPPELMGWTVPTLTWDEATLFWSGFVFTHLDYDPELSWVFTILAWPQWAWCFLPARVVATGYDRHYYAAPVLSYFHFIAKKIGGGCRPRDVIILRQTKLAERLNGKVLWKNVGSTVGVPKNAKKLGWSFRLWTEFLQVSSSIFRFCKKNSNENAFFAQCSAQKLTNIRFWD